MRGLSGRVFVVTGAGSGIGQACARRLAEEGGCVLAVDLLAERAAATAELAAALPGHIAPFTQDVTAPNAPEAVMAEAMRVFAGVHGLVNNAGLGNPRSIADTDDADLDHYMGMNFRATFRLSRAFVRVNAGQGGVIVNNSSVLGVIGFSGSATYSAAKAALLGLTRQMATEFGPAGFRVNAVAPGLIMTPAHTPERQTQNPLFYRTFLEGTPLARGGTPAEVGAAVAFLCSDDASFITGQALAVDGGWTTSKLLLPPADPS